MYSIRGAINVKVDEKSEINEASYELINKILEINDIDIDDIISIIFSCTNDLKSAYPAEMARKIGITNASLLNLQEMYVEDSMPMCIRILMFVNRDKKQKDIRHVYLRDTSKLRPDLMKEF